MIWVRNTPHEHEERRRDSLSRAFSWLIFQTCFFGVACYVILQIAAAQKPAPEWIQPMITIALIGFGGGIVGAFIAFSLLSARNSREANQ